MFLAVTFDDFLKLVNSRAITVIWLCIISMLICQLVKFVYISIKEKSPCWDVIHTTGGFPSSHSAMCATLMVSLFLFQMRDFGGVDSSFAVAVIFSIVTIHDAMGIRFEASKHAKILNNLAEGMPLEERKAIGFGKKGFLKELLGHKFFEVIGGIFFGVIVGIIGYFIVINTIG